MSDAALERALAALVQEASLMPASSVSPLLPLADAEALLAELMADVGVGSVPPPRVAPPSIFPIELEDVEDVELDDDEPVPLVARRGAAGREVLRPVSDRPLPPAFDALAEAVSSAALFAERHRSEAPPPLPRDADAIVLDEDDIIDFEPTGAPSGRPMTITELLEED
ncbi:MAG: hypothetical protein KC549_01795 [Myxococcales bacterium]|nr:hypothetical protein [Myxococcales bacterium]